jgi:CHAD domain-containing protein
MSKKNWQIPGLHNKLAFSKAADYVLKNRLRQVKQDIRSYFSEESVEQLHRIRISLRRLRYSMELFISCYDKKKFMILYNEVTELQDHSGKVRDFDVMTENMAILINKDKVKISAEVFRKVDNIKGGLQSNLKMNLMEFVHSEVLNDFEKLLGRVD